MATGGQSKTKAVLQSFSLFRNHLGMRFMLIPFFLCSILHAQIPAKPFPQNAPYAKDIIIPNHVAEKQMNEKLELFYLQWKNRYVKKCLCCNGYYIWSENAGKNNEVVSEGQGYGMMILVYMAGFDPEAKIIFDGLFQYYQEHASSRNKYLMSWAQSGNCKHNEASSATDGDIDIAYSLLLALKQWPSAENNQYRTAAANIINAITQQEINKETFSVLQSNSIEKESKDFYDMRSSDFIPAAFRSFYTFSGDSIWLRVIDKNYQLFYQLQRKFSKEAGLVPDFIQHIQSHPKPAHAYYLESRYDGMYNFNACRVPWRIGMDYILNGATQSKKFLEPVNNWIRGTTAGNPDNISAGYSLNGDDLKFRNYEALSFISSFAIAAMADKRNQDWLNRLWDYIIQFKLENFDYYDNSIKMLHLIVLSRHCWSP
jgi:endoglucanase